MMEGIERAANIKGHFSQRFPERNNDNWTLSFHRKDNMPIFINWLYKDATIYLKRKYDKYQEFLRDYEQNLLNDSVD